MRIPQQQSIVSYWSGIVNQDGTLQDMVNKINGNISNHGTITGADQVDTPFGSALDYISGNSDNVSLGDVYNGVNTVSLLVKPDSTTEYFVDMNGTANIDVNAGTIRANNFTSPEFFIDGVYDATPTLAAGMWTHITIVTGTGVNASAVVFGLIGANYSDMIMSHVIFWSVQLNGNEILRELYPAIVYRTGRR